MMIGGEKLNEEKRKRERKKKEKAEIIEAWKWTFQRRCSRPGYRDQFIKRWKSFVSASRGRVAINCNKKQKRYGHLARVVQRFRSARQPLIDIYRRWKRSEKLKTGCMPPFLGCASFHCAPLRPVETVDSKFVQNLAGRISIQTYPTRNWIHSISKIRFFPERKTGRKTIHLNFGKESIVWKNFRRGRKKGEMEEICVSRRREEGERGLWRRFYNKRVRWKIVQEDGRRRG